MCILLKQGFLYIITPLSLKKKDNNVTHFTMAVGYSGEKDSTVAATDAFDLLKKKMSNKQVRHRRM